MPDFTCQSCHRVFGVPDEVLARYPNWTPKLCMRCKKSQAGKSSRFGRSPTPSRGRKKLGGGASTTRELDLPVAEVLRRFEGGPKTGVFTDGAANPNPGPGGWGAVYVVDDTLVAERFGHEPHTTNNRMELLALRAGLELVPEGHSVTVFTDSELCVKTFTQWAKAWKERGWKRRGGEIKNLELVQEIYDALCRRPELELKWIAAHSGFRWNEYADALATAYRRTEK